MTTMSLILSPPLIAAGTSAGAARKLLGALNKLSGDASIIAPPMATLLEQDRALITKEALRRLDLGKTSPESVASNILRDWKEIRFTNHAYLRYEKLMQEFGINRQELISRKQFTLEEAPRLQEIQAKKRSSAYDRFLSIEEQSFRPGVDIESIVANDDLVVGQILTIKSITPSVWLSFEGYSHLFTPFYFRVAK